MIIDLPNTMDYINMKLGGKVFILQNYHGTLLLINTKSFKQVNVDLNTMEIIG